MVGTIQLNSSARSQDGPPKAGGSKPVPAASLAKRRSIIASAVSGRPAVTLPLSGEEAELAARLQPILAHPPHRREQPATQMSPLNDTRFNERLATVLRDEPDEGDTEPRALPEFADEPLIAAAAGHTPPAAPWIKQARRARWRSVARNSLPWLLTITVILATVAGTFVALVGTQKSTQLLARASSEVATGLALITH